MELTVLLPVWSGADHLTLALESLSAQTFGDWLCLVGDDGSRDGSQEIAQANAAKDRRFGILRSLQRLGVAATLQSLPLLAETPWMVRLDADDVCRADRFQRQLSACRRRPEVDLWGGRVEPLGDWREGERWQRYLAWLNGVVTEEAIRLGASTECPLPHASPGFGQDYLRVF
jgi:glycosyltransferase involved in cell wall biosynthesis